MQSSTPPCPQCVPFRTSPPVASPPALRVIEPEESACSSTPTTTSFTATPSQQRRPSLAALSPYVSRRALGQRKRRERERAASLHTQSGVALDNNHVRVPAVHDPTVLRRAPGQRKLRERELDERAASLHTQGGVALDNDHVPAVGDPQQYTPTVSRRALGQRKRRERERAAFLERQTDVVLDDETSFHQ